MVELVRRNVERVQLDDISVRYFCDYYEKEENRKNIIMIYDKDVYLTNIAYEEIINQKLDEEKEWMFFVFFLCRDKSVHVQNTGGGYKTAEELFEEHSYFFYILEIENDNSESNTMSFYTNRVRIQDEYKANFADLKNILQSKNIHSFFIKIPEIEDLNESAKHYEWKYEHLSVRANWTKEREREVRKYLYKFTELSYEDAKKKMLYEEKRKFNQKGLQNKTIYLVGPCIVAGWEGFPGETFCELLDIELAKFKLDYNIVQVVISSYANFNNRAVLEYDIKQNDIIFFLDNFMDEEVADVDFSYIYNNYTGENWLYSDVPIHTTQTGNMMIIQELIRKFIFPLAKDCAGICNQLVLHTGEKQLTFEEFILLQNYLKALKKYRKKEGIIGACVMTCNPFTSGHLHLIEYARKQVDFLYVFVVQEDACYFSFPDRLAMVQKGTRQFDNVIVLPSGQFIISRITFESYFKKEVCPEVTIDAKKDTMIFKNYIAPALRITKRFVGEEPKDNITNQYNQALKRELSDTIEIIEIPRKKISDEIISASRVRKYIMQDCWDQIEQMVPDSTFQYLKENIVKSIGHETSRNFKRIINLIREQDRVVLCGLGTDAENLMLELEKNLDETSIDKIEYYDKKASEQTYIYRGKKVLNIKELAQEYKNDCMIIATSVYKKDIFYLLIKQGICPSHIMIVK